jgi:hypothetical protein
MVMKKVVVNYTSNLQTQRKFSVTSADSASEDLSGFLQQTQRFPVTPISSALSLSSIISSVYRFRMSSHSVSIKCLLYSLLVYLLKVKKCLSMSKYV